MAKKYYLDNQGVIKMLQDISAAINNKTSSKVEVTQVENPETGEITESVKDPGNFATIGAVYDYASKKKKLTVNQQSAIEVSDVGYNVQDNIYEYNGNEATQIDLKLVDVTDIKKLFIKH